MISRGESLVSGKGLNIDDLAGSDMSSGWNDEWGPRSIHRYVLPNVRPGQRVLDLGGGYGRVSFPFALKGARIVMVDCEEEALDAARESYVAAGLSERIEKSLCRDVMGFTSREVGKFDYILASEVANQWLKSDALQFFARLYHFLGDDGGTAYVTGPSALGRQHDVIRGMVQDDPETRLEADTYMVWCDCIPEGRHPVPFFWPGEIEAVLEEQGGHVIASRDYVIPHSGAPIRDVIARFGKR